MAGFSEVIKLTIDVVTGNAKSQLATLKSDIGNAEGAFNKVKTAAGGMFDGIASSPAALAGVGLAVGKFALDSVNKFSETALAADKLRDSTGLSLDQAGRWIAVADDVGIGSDTITTAFGKMEKAIATNRTAFGDMVVTAKDGSVDLSATLLNVIEHLQGIKDPIERANEASKLFGKGFQGMSEILTTSAGDLKTALEGVSEAQRPNEAAVQSARDYQAALDDLSDAAGDVQRSLGAELMPTLTKLAGIAADGITIAVEVKTDLSKLKDEVDAKTGGLFGSLLDSAQQVINPVHMVTDAWNAYNDVMHVTGEASDALSGQMGVVEERLARYIPAAQTMADVTKTAAEAEKEAADAAKQLAADVQASEAAFTAATAAIQANADAARGASDASFALSDAQGKMAQFLTGYDAAVQATEGDQTKLNQVYNDGAKAAIDVADATVAVYEQTVAASGATLSGAQKIEIFNGAAIAQAATLSGPTRAALLDHIGQINNIPPEKVSEIKALIEQGKVAEAEAALNNASRTRNAELITSVLGVSAAEAALDSLTRTRNAIINAQIITKGGAGYGVGIRAAGGPVQKGQPYVVGEKQPELFVPDQNGTIVPKVPAASGAASGWSGAAGGTTSIIVNLPTGTDPAAVRRELDRYVLRNGSR